MGWWIKNDLKTVRKIYSLLENCRETPFAGIGQPELLKSNYSGYWSRRINLEHRLIYKVDSDNLIIFSLYGHYQS